jgi:hypothetical protein
VGLITWKVPSHWAHGAENDGGLGKKPARGRG